MPKNGNRKRLEFIESYIKIGNANYQWNDNHGELIRCKDCKFWQSRVFRIIDGKECNLCEMVNGYKPPDWFCADGERR